MPADNYALPGATNDSWRAWLTTGVRRAPADRRRLRGEYRGLKQMLLEGMTNGGERPHAWKDFSSAMVRHAVDEAMRTLPPQDKQVVKLAYFGGYSNREIAHEVGLTEATVQRRLRRALSAISAHIQQGRALGRRAAFALMAWLSGRWLTDGTHHLAQVALVASATVIVVAQPAGPIAATPPPVHETRSDIASTRQRASLPGAPLPAAARRPEPVQVPPAPVQVPPAPVQVQAPVLPVLPSLPPPPVKVKTPQL